VRQGPWRTGCGCFRRRTRRLPRADPRSSKGRIREDGIREDRIR
jgi:hypothetical protein